MNTRIKALEAELQNQNAANLKIKEKLQTEFNKVFDDSKELTKAISNAENASEYQFNRYGDIESWYFYDGLAEISDYSTDIREFFENWLSENHCMAVDWENNCLLMNQGDDNLIIQDETERDNGVWQNGNLIIAESEYKNEDGEIDVAKRNALIEAHMEKTGYFPGVFRATYHGEVFAVNTSKEQK